MSTAEAYLSRQNGGSLMFQKGRAECSLWIQLLVLDVVINWKVVELELIDTNYQCGPWL